MRDPHPPLDKLTRLRRNDHFRYWASLDDERVCVLCDKTFAGHEIVVSENGNGLEVHCPTTGCHSQVHQWVYPGNPFVCGSAYADWWQALSEPAEHIAQAI